MAEIRRGAVNKKKVAIYCRVDRGGTSEAQRDILEIQKERLERYAGSHELQIAGCYQDVGYPGHDLSRPGLNQMTADYKAGKFDAVLIAKHTRLFRGSAWNEPQWPFPVISLNQLDRIRHEEKKR